jgi:hypothetical protein
MIRLNTTTRSLQALLAGAITTNQLPVTVGYSDGTSAVYTGAAQLTLTNSATPVTICSAPASGVVRDIDYIAVSNTDTAAATVTVRLNDNGTLYEQVKATLSAGRQLVYTHASGWNVGDVNATPIGANPTASVGLAAVNGSALTFMRSDAAPALSQSITPTWTGAHVFSSTVAMNGGVTLGDAAGDALTINSTSWTIGGATTITGGQVTIANNLRASRAVVAGNNDLSILNTDNTNAASSARVVISAGGSTAGDPFVIFDIAAVTDWAVGVDNSDGDSFKIAMAASLGTAATDFVRIPATGEFQTARKIYPSTPPGAFQTSCGLFGNVGAPNNADGANGDIYFRSDGGALTTIYQKRAGAWVGII